MATGGRSEALEELQQQLVAFVLEEAGRRAAADPDAPLSTALIEAVRREVELKVAALARPDAESFAEEVLAALKEPIAAAVVGAIQATPIKTTIEGDGAARRSATEGDQGNADSPGLPAALMGLRRGDQAVLAGLAVLLLLAGGAIGWIAHRPKAPAAPPAATAASLGGQVVVPPPETPISDKPPGAASAGQTSAASTQAGRQRETQTTRTRTTATPPAAPAPAAPRPTATTPPATPLGAPAGSPQPQNPGGGGQ